MHVPQNYSCMSPKLPSAAVEEFIIAIVGLRCAFRR